jgi:hypothetical protein
VGNGGILSAILSEQPDDVLEDLERRLKQRIAEARNVLAQSESELSLVRQAINARGRPALHGAGEFPGAVETERDREADGRFQGIPRRTVLAVASTVEYPITPVRVVEAFAELGETVNVEQIRIALNRIAKDGDLTKVGPSLFSLPGKRPTELQTTPQRQPTSGPGPAREPEPFGRVLGPAAVSPNAFRRTS